MSAPLVALTGATGFIGRHLLTSLPAQGYRVRALLRRPVSLPTEISSAVIGDIAAPRNMAAALEGVDYVIHSAGLAHAGTPGGASGHPDDDYRTYNTQATLALARAAEKAGARRFVFLSSIRAQSGPVSDHVLTEADPPRPTDAYGRSKLAAEDGLKDLAMDWAALRPVLVYGPGVKGNMAALIRLAALPVPLPLGGLTARRSLVSLDNLNAALVALLAADGPLRRPFIAADPAPVTVPAIIASLRAGMGRAPGLIRLPASGLRLAASLVGKVEAFERLAGELVADAGALRTLGYVPVSETQAALRQLGADVRAGRIAGSPHP